MDCSEFIKMMNMYLDNDLEEIFQDGGKSHLAKCPDCCKEMAYWQACLDLLRKTFPEQVPPVKLWEKIQCKTYQQSNR